MITLSANESQVLGVRVARGVLNGHWQPEELLSDILAGGFDFVRVKLPSTDEQVFEKLDQLGMHYCIHSILVRNSTPINALHAKPYRPLRVSFELYNGTQEAELKQLVKDSWGNRTAVNYHNPYFRHWVSYQQEIEGSAAYATEFNHLLNPSMPNWLVKLDGKTIGFVLGKVSEAGFEGIMYSILPEHRGQNYAEDIMIFLKKWCYEQGIGTFFNDVVFQNMPSLKSIVTESIVPVDTYLNITISPLLQATRQEVALLDVDNWESMEQLPIWLGKQSSHWQKAGYSLHAMRVSSPKQAVERPNQILVSKPIDTVDMQLVVLRLLQSGCVMSSVYLTYKAVC